MGSRLDVEHAVQIAVVSQHAEGDPAPVVGSVRSPLGPLGIDHREQLRAGATDDRRVEAAGKIQQDRFSDRRVLGADRPHDPNDRSGMGRADRGSAQRGAGRRQVVTHRAGGTDVRGRCTWGGARAVLDPALRGAVS